MQNRVVYIANQSGETVLHEALHTATMALVLQFYADPSRLDPVQRAAVENLEKLMTQFMDMDFSRTLRRDIEGEEIPSDYRNNPEYTAMMTEDEVAMSKRHLREYTALFNSDLSTVIPSFEEFQKQRNMEWHARVAELKKPTMEMLNVAQVLQRQIAAQDQSELGRATALNEFMAWSLSNQNLIDVMRKTKVRTPLRELVFRATGWVRKLLGLAPTQKLDMFSNILTNTAGLIQGDSRLIGPRAPLSVVSGVVMNQMTGTPVDARLADLMERFRIKIEAHLEARKAGVDPLGTEELKIKNMANHAVGLFKFHGFDMDDQQASAFRKIQRALASSMELDKRALVQAQRVYNHVMKQLSPKDFEGYPDGNLRSQSRFDVLTGEHGCRIDTAQSLHIPRTSSRIRPGFRAFAG